jgi:hypothetical protein
MWEKKSRGEGLKYTYPPFHRPALKKFPGGKIRRKFPILVGLKLWAIYEKSCLN